MGARECGCRRHRICLPSAIGNTENSNTQEAVPVFKAEGVDRQDGGDDNAVAAEGEEGEQGKVQRMDVARDQLVERVQLVSGHLRRVVRRAEEVVLILQEEAVTWMNTVIRFTQQRA